MLNTFDNLAVGNVWQNGDSSNLTTRHQSANEHGPTFSKIFRWQPSGSLAPVPVSVELAGSFTDGHKVALTRDPVTNTWQVTFHGILGNRTHRYMLLVGGEPTHISDSDGLAIPESVEENRYQLRTPRGARVFLLFAQTK